MSYVAFSTVTWKRVRAGNGNEVFANERVAKRVLNQYLTKEYGQHADAYRGLYKVTPYTEWHTTEPMVETYNLMDPDKKPIQIRLSEKGGCTDPATERYHSM